MGVQEMTAQDVLDLYVLPLFHWHKQQLRQRTELQPSQTQQQQEDEDLIAALRFVVLSKRLLDEAWTAVKMRLVIMEWCDYGLGITAVN
eukprot:scaffold215723_cov22-Tisochrysis_lutea.AAC.1